MREHIPRRKVSVWNKRGTFYGWKHLGVLNNEVIGLWSAWIGPVTFTHTSPGTKILKIGSHYLAWDKRV